MRVHTKIFTTEKFRSFESQNFDVFKKSFPHTCTYEDFDYWKIQITFKWLNFKVFEKSFPHNCTCEDFDYWKSLTALNYNKIK